MNISLIVFILILVYYLNLKQDEYNPDSINRLIKFGCLLLILESGLRHVEVGIDTRGYYASFYEIASTSWPEVLSALFVDAEDFRDPGFSILIKAFSSILPSWQLFLIAAAILYYYAMGKLFQRYIQSCTGVLLAFALVLSLFEIIALSGIRQMVTIAVSMLIVPLIFDRKWIIVIPTIVLTSLIHISALFITALIPFAFINEETNHKLHLVALCLFPIVAVSARNIVRYMAGFLANDYYMVYANSESQESVGTYVIVALLISVFVFFTYQSTRRKTSFPKPSIPATVMMTLAVPLIVLDGTMIRIGQYFTLYMMITLPTILDVNSYRKQLYWVMFVFLLYFIFTRGSNYYFFWQSVPSSDFIYRHPFIGL